MLVRKFELGGLFGVFFFVSHFVCSFFLSFFFSFVNTFWGYGKAGLKRERARLGIDMGHPSFGRRG